MNPATPESPDPAEKNLPQHASLIPKEELARKALLPRIKAARERLSRGAVLNELQAELDRQAITGRPLSPAEAARPLSREPEAPGRER